MMRKPDFSKITGEYTRNIRKLKQALGEADAVLIGAGAGLSTSAGFVYNGKRFRENFSDFEQKYGFHDMYSGGFYPYPTPEEFWAFWSRNIMANRYTDPPKPVYQNLLELVKGKDYFVLTTNVDHCFQKVGFDKKRLFYTQGDYGLFQCAVPCHKLTYDNEAQVRAMVDLQEDMKVPSELIPKCPVCGRTMTLNLRSDDRFVEDEGWHEAAERYEDFVRTRQNTKLLCLELGVGFNTPGIIKYPFMRLVMRNPSATYACINYGEAAAPDEIESRSICINADIGEVLDKLLEGETQLL